jgi:hypothetical protein
MYLARHTRRGKRLRGLGDTSLPGQAQPSVLTNLWDDIRGIFNGQMISADYNYLVSLPSAMEPGSFDQQLETVVSGNPTEQQIAEVTAPGIYVGPNAPAGNSSLYQQVAAGNAPLLAPYIGGPDLTPVSTSTYWIIGIFAGLVVLGIAVSK